jgi:hypothetical protein
MYITIAHKPPAFADFVFVATKNKKQKRAKERLLQRDGVLRKTNADVGLVGRLSDCPVCNSTMPCLYDILADPSETNNIAADHPDIVARLAPVLQLSNDEQYVTGHLDPKLLAAKYKPIEKSRWEGYLGPCFEPK